MSNSSKKSELMKYTGSLQQVAYVRPVVYTEGRSSGLKAWDVKNGPLSYQVMADKCLDVNQLSYKGININFLSIKFLTYFKILTKFTRHITTSKKHCTRAFFSTNTWLFIKM